MARFVNTPLEEDAKFEYIDDQDTLQSVTVDPSVFSGGGSRELFECTYGTTTYAEITAALTAGKIPYVVYNNRYYWYVYQPASGQYGFASGYASSVPYIRCYESTDTWNYANATAQYTSNLVTTIDSSSTDTKYPSAKCVYDAIQNSAIATITYTSTTEATIGVDFVFAQTYSDLYEDFVTNGKQVLLRCVSDNLGAGSNLSGVILLSAHTVYKNASNLISASFSYIDINGVTQEYNVTAQAGSGAIEISAGTT